MILIVIPILIVFIAAIFIIRQMMEDSAIRNIERVQKNMCMNLENEIQDAALRLSHFLYVNDGTITKAAAKTDTYDMEKKRVLSKELDRYFNFAMCPIEDIAAATFFMKNGNYTNLKEDFSISMAEIKGADWYAQALKNKNKVAVGSFNKINYIFVETESMKEQLESQGYDNVEVIPNCKELDILDAKTIKYTEGIPYRLCTFSRVIKEKGIEDAVQAVCEINSKYDDIFAELDIYGQIEDSQKEWFEQLQASLPQYIRYKGMVPFNQSTEVLKNYDALLFPTYYEGEGFAGTIIDAFAAGLPVIASDWKYNSEIIKQGITGVITKTHSISELKNAILSINSDVEKWNFMRKNCISEAKMYLPANAMKKLIDIVNG